MKMIRVSKKLGYVKAYKAKDGHYYGFVPMTWMDDMLEQKDIARKDIKAISPIANSNTTSNR